MDGILVHLSISIANGSEVKDMPEQGVPNLCSKLIEIYYSLPEGALKDRFGAVLSTMVSKYGFSYCSFKGVPS